MQIGIYVDVESMYFGLQKQGRLDYGRLHNFWSPVGDIKYAGIYGLKRKGNETFLNVTSKIGYTWNEVQSADEIYAAIISDVLKYNNDLNIFCTYNPAIRYVLTQTSKECLVMGLDVKLEGVKHLEVPDSMILRG